MFESGCFSRAGVGILGLLLIGVAGAAWGASGSENFDGAYVSGVCVGWATSQSGWGDTSREWSEESPGRGGSGSAQEMRSNNGEMFLSRTFAVGAFREVDISVWLRTYQYDGTAASPGGNWVEFGWDPDGGTDPGAASWNANPKTDYGNNVGTWTQYTEQGILVGSGGNITVFFKVGASGSPGIQVHFDDVVVTDVAVFEDFDGTYTSGVHIGWATSQGSWGDTSREWSEESPGRGGSGSAQEMRSNNGELFLYRTFDVTVGEDYDISVWLRTYQYDGTAASPGSNWVEFGWDTDGGTDPGAASWNANPKTDYGNNVATWTQYTETSVTAGVGGQITVFFKVGASGSPGIQVHFDDVELRLTSAGGPPTLYYFPDVFDGTYEFGRAPGWSGWEEPGGTEHIWAEDTSGYSGSAQMIEGSIGSLLGAAKVFEVSPTVEKTLFIYIKADNRSGGPITSSAEISFGYDLTGQTSDHTAGTITWYTDDPTSFFRTSGNEGTWQLFLSDPITPTGGQMSVWLEVDATSSPPGVRASFDELSFAVREVATDVERWEIYE